MRRIVTTTRRGVIDTETVTAWQRPTPVLVAIAGLVTLSTSWWWANDGRVPEVEVSVFRWLNDSVADGLEPLLWLPMQFGAVGAIVLVVVAQLLVLRHWLPAAVTALVGVEAWIIARVVKPIVERGRPGVEIDEVVQRGGSIGGGHDEGFGFVSGHAAVAFGLALALHWVLPRRWRWLPWFGVASVGAGRVYFGAHLPLDIVGGYGLGALLAGTTIAVVARASARFATP